MTTETLIRGEEFSITFDVVVDPDLLDDASDYLTNTATVAADGLNFNGYTITVNDQSGTDTGSGFDNDEPTSTIVPEIADMLTLFDDIEAEFGSAYLNVTGLAVQTSRVPEQLQRQILLGKAIQR